MVNQTRIPYLVLIGVLAAGQASAVQIDATDKNAWSENSGWISHRQSPAETEVYSDHLEGYSWGENIGWIRLGTATDGGDHQYTNTSASDWGVNRDDDGRLSGFAWSENTGWINFAAYADGLTINPDTGDFSGFVWSENLGWIHLGDSNTSTYGTSVVKTDLAVTQSDGSDPVRSGTELVYTVAVENLGSNAAEEIRVSTTLASGVSLVSTSLACTEGAAAVPICTLPSLGPGEIQSFTIRVAVAATTSGPIDNLVQVNALTGDADVANNTSLETTQVPYDWDEDGLPDSWDQAPETVHSNTCNQADVILSNWIIRNGTVVTCRTSSSIAVSSSVKVESGGILALVSPAITAEAGFQADTGSRFRAFASNVIRGSEQSVNAEPAIVEQSSSVVKKGAEGAFMRPGRIGADSLPAGLIRYFGSRDALPEPSYSDAEGEYIVFTSNRPLLEEDTNEAEDIYLYETFSEQLLLVSKTEDGQTVMGRSLYPVIDAYGGYIAFSSTGRLVAEDTDDFSDVYLYYIGLDYLSQISSDTQQGSNLPSRRPAMDAAGFSLLYEQGVDGARSIVSVDPLHPYDGIQAVTPPVVDGTSEDHHPGIAPEGDYIAWLNTGEEGCKIMLQHTLSQTIETQDCPFMYQEENVQRPWFDPGKRNILWVTTSDTGEVNEYSQSY